jgi:predicted enzyme related to lactoylglutathione lyase
MELAGRSDGCVEAHQTSDKEVNMEIELSDLGQIGITVSDIDTALPFYRDILGLSFLFQPAPSLAFLMAGCIRIMLSTPQGAGTVGGNSILYFKVSDIDAAYEAIVGRGAIGERIPQLTAKLPDHELWVAFIRDPDRNLIGLMEERR